MSHSGIDEDKQIQTMMFPAPCFTDRIRFFCWNSMFVNYLKNSSVFYFIVSWTALLFSVLLMVDSWTLTRANVREAFSWSEVTLSPLWTSRLLHTLILEWYLLSDHSYGDNNGPELAHSLPDCVLVESKLFRDDLVTFSSLLTTGNKFFFFNLFSWLLWNVHDALDQISLKTSKHHCTHWIHIFLVTRQWNLKMLLISFVAPLWGSTIERMSKKFGSYILRMNCSNIYNPMTIHVYIVSRSKFQLLHYFCF